MGPTMLATTESVAPAPASPPPAPAVIAADACATDSLVGRRVNGRFLLTSLIARGGMGKVYRAEQAPLGRVCAVKVLDARCIGDAAVGLDKRFWLEAAVTSSLSHPNIVTVFECGRTAGDVPYIAMEYLVGCTLSRAIRAAGHFSEERTIHVARQICCALREAHAAGVVHRDLKPTNVFLVENGDEADFVKVLDFGLVTSIATDRREELTEKHMLLGSPRYMAPEQIRGERVDARADVYALGIVMYEMMTGRVPFGGPSHVQILTAHLNENPPPIRSVRESSVPTQQIEQIVGRCIEKDRERRFGSMADVLAALDRLEERECRRATCTPAERLEERECRRATCTPEEPVPAYTAALWVGGSSCAVAEQTPDGNSGNQRCPRPVVGCSAGLMEPAVMAALAILAVAALVASGSSRSDASPTTHPAIVGAPDAAGFDRSEERRTDLPLLGRELTIEVTAEPPDSTVKEDDVELCRMTPCAVLYETRGNEPEASHVLTVSRDGYRSETRKVTVKDSPVSVTLTPMPSAPKLVVPRTVSKDQTVLSGYRLEVPY
jgi:serine/threonine-protein kinase